MSYEEQKACQALTFGRRLLGQKAYSYKKLSQKQLVTLNIGSGSWFEKLNGVCRIFSFHPIVSRWNTLECV